MEENRFNDRIKYGSHLAKNFSSIVQMIVFLEKKVILAIYSFCFSPGLEIEDAGPDVWVLTLTNLSFPVEVPYWLDECIQNIGSLSSQDVVYVVR